MEAYSLKSIIYTIITAIIISTVYIYYHLDKSKINLNEATKQEVTQESNKSQKLINIQDSTSPENRRINLNRYKVEEDLTEFEIGKLVSGFNVNGNFYDIISELEIYTDLKISYIDSTYEEVQIDPRFSTEKNKLEDLKQCKYDNLSILEVIRYIAITFGLKYKIIEETGEVIFALPDAILAKTYKRTYPLLSRYLKRRSDNQSKSEYKELIEKNNSLYSFNYAGVYLELDNAEIVVTDDEGGHKLLESIEASLQNPRTQTTHKGNKIILEHNSIEDLATFEKKEKAWITLME